VVLSHPDGGHLGGGAAVWEAFPVKQALMPVERSRSPGFRAWMNEAPAAGVRLLTAAGGNDLPMPDGARLEVIHAPDPLSQNASADDRVAIYRLHWRGWKLLLTSDAGLGTELEMLDRNKDVRADVILAGRHRGDVTLCDRFLDAVDPQAIVASHSDFPTSERLKPEKVEYWQSRGIQVIHQGEAGGVTLRVDRQGNLRLEGFADRSVMVLTPR
jgi:competence protein ComEC